MYSYHSNFDLIRHNRVMYSEYIPKAGDIILFNSGTHAFYNSIILKNYFSHAAIVIEDEDGNIFLSEASSNLILDSDGNTIEYSRNSKILPIKNRLHNYTGSIYIMKLNKQLTPDMKKILFSRARVETLYPNIKEFVLEFFRIKKIDTKKKRHCMHHILWMLDEINIYNICINNYNKTFLGNNKNFITACTTMTSINKLKLSYGYSYSDIYKYIYDGPDE